MYCAEPKPSTQEEQPEDMAPNKVFIIFYSTYAFLTLPSLILMSVSIDLKSHFLSYNACWASMLRMWEATYCIDEVCPPVRGTMAAAALYSVLC